MAVKYKIKFNFDMYAIERMCPDNCSYEIIYIDDETMYDLCKKEFIEEFEEQYEYDNKHKIKVLNIDFNSYDEFGEYIITLKDKCNDLDALGKSVIDFVSAIDLSIDIEVEISGTVESSIWVYRDDTHYDTEEKEFSEQQSFSITKFKNIKVTEI